MAKDCLLEIQTEELPARGLYALGCSFCEHAKKKLQQAELRFTEVKYFVTPRRLTLLIKHLSEKQPDREMTRKGPAKSVVFDVRGQITETGLAFMRAQAVTPDQFITIRSEQGKEWIGVKQKLRGKMTVTLLPELIAELIRSFPLTQSMRWGAEVDVPFIRPVRGVLLLYGVQLIRTKLLGCMTINTTPGHSFLSCLAYPLPEPAMYETILAKQAYVIADFNKRRDLIKQQLQQCLLDQIGPYAVLCMQSAFSRYPNVEALLEEVTGLVEWPTIFLGCFDPKFLVLPPEVLVSAMQDHQRYFPVMDQRSQTLLPYFLVVSNIPGDGSGRIVQGNERVLRARLNDATFFYERDQQQSLIVRRQQLKQIIFQEKLGTVYAKSERMSQLAEYLAQQCNVDVESARRAAQLAKTDLTTQMVNEFPILQGVMGGYYAQYEGESESISQALREHYLPRFAHDQLPESQIGQIIGIADRIDLLVGVFSLNQAPTGDKDPYGVRRAAIGLLRIVIEKKVNVDFQPLLQLAIANCPVSCVSERVSAELTLFILGRLRIGYQQKGISMDSVMAAMQSLWGMNLYALDQRINAIQLFKKESYALALVTVYKRIKQLLSKWIKPVTIKEVCLADFEQDAEKGLFQKWNEQKTIVMRLCQVGDYITALRKLMALIQPINDFFNQVLVMVEDVAQRENRLGLLYHLQSLFLQIGDISLLSINTEDDVASSEG